MSSQNDKKLWQQITAQVTREWDTLPTDEKSWIRDHTGEIVRLQSELHQLFLAVDGEKICCDCHGDCCGHGKFHPNLTNLLAFLAHDDPIPSPDFSQGCPYLGDSGCLFPPGLRPYNCISFICEKIEDNLLPTKRSEFWRLEQAIRAEYELFIQRYVGAGLHGILVKGEALPSYLDRR